MWSAARVGTAVSLIVCLASLGCARGEAEAAGSHRFAVPEPYRVPASDRPFFLAQDGNDGFTFVLNPTAVLPKQILVRVDTKANICGRPAGIKAYVNSTVCRATPLEWSSQELRRSGDNVFWTYALTAPDKAVLISCSEVCGPARGFCMSPLPFDDLVLTLHFDDGEVGRLATDYDAATALLRSWER